LNNRTRAEIGWVNETVGLRSGWKKGLGIFGDWQGGWSLWGRSGLTRLLFDIVREGWGWRGKYMHFYLIWTLSFEYFCSRTVVIPMLLVPILKLISVLLGLAVVSIHVRVTPSPSIIPVQSFLSPFVVLKSELILCSDFF
jgi:hypothetical protein